MAVSKILSKLSLGIVFLSISTLVVIPAFNNPQAQAESQTTSTVGLSIDTVLSLSVANCPGLPDTNSSSITFNTMPTPTGTFASNCQTLSIDTNAPGYSLLAKSNSTNLEYLNPTTVSPTPNITPITSSLSSSPTTITPNHWGFAAKGNNITLNPNTTTYPGLNFTQTYTANNKDNTYSTLPTTDTTLYSTDQIPGKTDQANFYYATNINTSQLAGTYSTTVTYTVVGEDVPEVTRPLVIYDNGDEKVDITGGWEIWRDWSYANSSGNNAVKMDDGLYDIDSSLSGYSQYSFSINNHIDISPYNSVEVINNSPASIAGSTCSAPYAGIYNIAISLSNKVTVTTSGDSNSVFSMDLQPTTTEPQTLIYDISSSSIKDKINANWQNYYFTIRLRTPCYGNNTGSMKIKKITLLP